jgi:hypothetical protein
MGLDLNGMAQVCVRHALVVMKYTGRYVWSFSLSDDRWDSTPVHLMCSMLENHEESSSLWPPHPSQGLL